MAWLLAGAAAAVGLIGPAGDASAQSPGDAAGQFRSLGGVIARGTPRALVTTRASSTTGPEKVFITYSYVPGSFDIVEVNPATGTSRIFAGPLPGEGSAYALAVGPDGNIYMGTEPHGRLARLNPRGAGTITNLGSPAPSESYIWALTQGTDKKLYGCTYPSAKLIRLDPGTGKSEDLGRMDATEKYARYCVAGKDGFVYVGTGPQRANFLAYEIATGKRVALISESQRTPGFGEVYLGTDGRVYGSTTAGKKYRLENGRATAVTSAPLPQTQRLANTDSVEIPTDEYEYNGAVIRCPRGLRPCAPLKFPYAGKPIQIFRVGLGPDDRLYGATLLPAYLIRSTESSWTNLGWLGAGQVHSMLSHGQKLMLGVYARRAELMAYDPALAFGQSAGPGGNPRMVGNEGVNWRPNAMVAGADGHVYVGNIPGYGKLEGHITRWNTGTNALERYSDVVRNQSIVSLAAVPPLPGQTDQLLVGGSYRGGGPGAQSIEPSGKVFLWDTATRRTVFETVPNPRTIQVSNVVVVGRTKAYAVAHLLSRRFELLTFDLVNRSVSSSPWPCGEPLTESSVLGRGAQIWTVTREGICATDPVSATARLVARSPAPPTGGFARRGDKLYFASDRTVYEYTMPSTVALP